MLEPRKNYVNFMMSEDSARNFKNINIKIPKNIFTPNITAIKIIRMDKEK